MGVGTPRDLIVAIGAGVDMFDCVLPTRNARNGQALTRTGRIVIKQARWRDDPRPIDESCGCPCCRGGYSRAYLRHLFLAGEILVLRLLSAHNLWLYGELTREARAAIVERRFEAWAAGRLRALAESDEADPKAGAARSEGGGPPPG
jgi:queuine tRNA-ribosyltransferase